jgi:hypothetical protein
VVVEYDQVDISSFGGKPRSGASQVCGADVVWAASQVEAICQRGKPGFFDAFPLPDGLTPIPVTLGVDHG